MVPVGGSLCFNYLSRTQWCRSTLCGQRTRTNWQYRAKPYCKEKMQRAHTNAIRSPEWVEWHLTPPSEQLSESYSHIILCMAAWSYVFLCLTYMQSCLDASSCSCITNVGNVRLRNDFFRKLNKTPSSLFADSCLAQWNQEQASSLSLSMLRFHKRYI